MFRTQEILKKKIIKLFFLGVVGKTIRYKNGVHIEKLYFIIFGLYDRGNEDGLEEVIYTQEISRAFIFIATMQVAQYAQ